MKRFSLLIVSAAVSACAFSESLQILTLSDDGVPGYDDPPFMGMGISPDARYVCGTCDGKAVFIADRVTGEIKYEVIESTDDDTQLRHVTNTGIGIGLAEDGILYSFDTGDISMLGIPNDVRYVLGEDITGNGEVMVGSLIGLPSGQNVGAYSNDGVNWNRLPMPTSEEINGLVKLDMGTCAKFVSSDAKVIFGHVGSFELPIAWVMNERGEYEVDPFIVKYLKTSRQDKDDPSKPLASISGMYYTMSDNGRYFALIGLLPTEYDDEYRSVPVVYDMVEKALKIYDEVQFDGMMYGDLYPMVIADDGTFIGCVGMPNFGSEGSFIMRAGETQAELYTEAFPAYNEKFGKGDAYGFNVPTGISADGRYLLGYIFYADDYLSGDGYVNYLTYIIDRQGDPSGVDTMAPECPEVEEVYSIDGRRLDSIKKGLNIVRSIDGSVCKILKK